jgi:hypothetical protein
VVSFSKKSVNSSDRKLQASPAWSRNRISLDLFHFRNTRAPKNRFKIIFKTILWVSAKLTSIGTSCVRL